MNEAEVLGAAARRARRIVWWLMLLYLFAGLDRVNIGFAALTMNKAIGLGPAEFGFGAGLFFLTYVLLEIPSNIMLVRLGARRWIARVAISWGLVSAATAFVTGAHGFYAARALLGVAEAGFFPAVIVTLARWFPTAWRTRMNMIFMMGIPLNGAVAAVMAGGLLRLDGALGLAGWQWILLAEGIPACLLGIATVFVLPDGPEQARFLSPAEKSALRAQLATEDAARQTRSPQSPWDALRNPICWALGAAYFGVTVGLSTLGLWLPQVIDALGARSPTTVGLITAIPLALGAAGMAAFAISSDRRGERLGHLLAASVLAGAGWLGYLFVGDPIARIATLAAAAGGTYGMLAIFWALPTAYLSGTAAAVGIALITAVGTSGSFIGPWVIGALRKATGDFDLALAFVALCCLSSGAIAWVVGPRVLAGPAKISLRNA